MNFFSNKLTGACFVLFLTGSLTGCAIPKTEAVSRASQLQAQALAQDVQIVSKSSGNCRSEAILAELQDSLLSQEQPVSVIQSAGSSTAFAIFEVEPEVSDDDPSDPSGDDVGNRGDTGDKDGEGTGAGQGHDVSSGDNC